jgi:tRNA-binding protein
MNSIISRSDFEQIDLRIGTIIDAQEFPQAKKPAYILTIDFGVDIGIKKSSAQITHHYSIDQLINTQILAVVNFQPKQIGPFVSECLVTGIYDANNNIILMRPEYTVKNGSIL